MNLHEFSFEVNLRTIIREDRTVVFEAWAWVPKNDQVQRAVSMLGPPDREIGAGDWVRIAWQDVTFELALKGFYGKAHRFCANYWAPEPEPEPEVVQRPKRKLRIDRS